MLLKNNALQVVFDLSPGLFSIHNMRALQIITLCIATASAADLRTHLTGFHDCQESQKAFIIDAWEDARGVMDLIRTLKIDWNETAAVEYLGPPDFTTKRQGDIQGTSISLGELPVR